MNHPSNTCQLPAANCQPPLRPKLWIPVRSLWWRDVIRFLRQRNRIVSALATPLIFWLLVGFGFNPSFHNPEMGATGSYLTYFFPGTITLIMLFTAIFSTVSVIEDRREGFLQGALVAPISGATIPLGKFLGGMTLSVLQAYFFCLLAPLAGIPIGWEQLLLLFPAFILVGFSMTGLGFLVAWPMDSTQGFHAVMMTFLMPLWMMSGALFPMPAGSGWLYWVGRLNPVSYSVSAIREALTANSSLLPHYIFSLLITALFGFVTFGLSVYLVIRPKQKK